MGRFDPKTGRTICDAQGHMGNGVKGITTVEKDGVLKVLN